MTHSALATRLPRLDPAHARLQTSLLAAINGARAGDLVLRAGVTVAATPATIGFDTVAGRIELGPLIADGAVPLLVADDGLPDAVMAIDALARIEPLVVAIERALGVALQPVAVAVPVEPVRLRVDALDGDGAVRHAVVLGTASDAAFDLAPLPVDLKRAERLRVGVKAELIGPRLAPWQVAALDPGDLLLVGQCELVGTIHAAGRSLPARFRADTATLTIADQQGPAMNDVPTLDPDLRLAMRVVIDGGTASLGEVARLAPGSVVPLGIAGATLPVTLMIGDDPVAAGELVAVGEAYGVLVTRRIGG